LHVRRWKHVQNFFIGEKDTMKTLKFIKVATFMLVVFALILAGCQPAAPAEPAAVEPAAPEAPVATEAPAEAEAPAETEAPAAEPAVGGTLRLLTWEGYAPSSMVDKFTQETGIKVELTYIGDNNELITKLAATEGYGFDLAQPTLNWVTTAQEQFGIYQPIDMSKLKVEQFMPSLLDSTEKGTTFEGATYAVPFNWGTTALIINTELAPEAGSTYMDLCDEAYQGRISYRAKYDSFYMFGFGLGLDPYGKVNDEAAYRDVMEQILAKMIECKPLVKTYWGSRQENEDLIKSNEVWVSSGWDATGWSLSMENPKIKYLVPQEGAVGWVDTFAITAGSENIDAAYAWINFIMQPENAAVVTNETGNSMASEGALDLSSAEMAALFAESFPADKLANIQWYIPLPTYAQDIEADVQERLKAAPSE
jgi:spermidine/putrescine transport system substrate-binding protein